MRRLSAARYANRGLKSFGNDAGRPRLIAATVPKAQTLLEIAWQKAYRSPVTMRWKRRKPKNPITIGDDCWIGGDVTILPGVTIGAGCVIGAKSLVTKDIPAGYVAMGAPCRPVRPITDANRISESL